MKQLIVFALCAPLFASESGANLDQFLDIKANYTIRNVACLALRGDRTPDVIVAMRESIENSQLQACAAANLRIAGAVDELTAALKSSDASTRAAAARELGTMQKPELLPVLMAAAKDKDVLVASNAVEGLVRYEDHSSAPQLREVALMGGVLTTLAMDTLIQWGDAETAALARKLMAREDPGDLLAGVRAVGIVGDQSDLARLRILAKDDTNLGSGGRGFGLMPAISVSRAAQTAIQNIGRRAEK